MHVQRHLDSCDTLNVWQERLPEFDYEGIGANYKAVKHETMTEAESHVWGVFNR